MRSLYITADQIGMKSGGGRVTFEEYKALEQLGHVDPIDRLRLGASDNPFDIDDRCFEMISNFSKLPEFKEIKLAHFYAGTFSRTITELQRLGVKVSYTCAAHDRHVSAREYEQVYGEPFALEHLKDGPLWERYVAGYRAADLLIVPSTYSKDLMVKYGCQPERIKVIPHGTDLPKTVAPMPKQFTVGYMGSAGTDKGLRYLFQAWKQLDLKDSQLLIAGPYNQIPVLTDLYRQFGGGNVRLLGFVPTIDEFFAQISLYVQPSVCLLPGSLVETEDSPKAVETLVVGDKVLAADGQFREVIKPLKNEYRGNIYAVSTCGFSLPTRMTGAHRVLCIQRGLTSRKKRFETKTAAWVEAWRLHREAGLGSTKIARELGLNERMVASWIYQGSRPEGLEANFSVREAVEAGKLAWVHAQNLEVGDVVVVPRIKQSVRVASLKLPGKRFAGSRGNSTRPLPENIVVDEEILKFLGYYVSEACADERGDIGFCFHKKETAFIDHVCRCLKNRFGIPTRVVYHRHKQSAVVWACSVLLSQWLRDLCGQGAHGKRFPSWALQLPADQLIPLLRGAWDGDGSVYVTKRGRLGTSYSTVSETLAHQMFLALVKLGFKPTVYWSDTRGFKINVNGAQTANFVVTVLGRDVPAHSGRTKTSEHTVIDADYYYMPISKIDVRAYRGDVFNLEVEGNPSYSAPFVVHNSEGFGIEIVEAMAHGRPVVASAGAGAAELVKRHKCGTVVPAGDVQELAKTISFYLGSRDATTDDGARGRSFAEFYQWGRIRDQYVQEWTQLPGGPKR